MTHTISSKHLTIEKVNEIVSKGLKIELGKVAPVIPEVSLKVGDLVRMSEDATVYGHTVKYSPFMYKTYLYLRELNGNRAVVSTQPEGPVSGPVDVKYLTKV